MKKILTFVTAALCLFCLNSKLFADDASGTVDPTLGGFVLQNNDNIEMTDEVVEIWKNHVKVTFHFKNLTDQAQKVTVGFPIENFRYKDQITMFWDEREPLENDEETLKRISDYYSFTSTCNGKKLPRQLVTTAHAKEYSNDDEKFDFWFTSDLTFKPGETLEVVDEYNMGPSVGSDSIGYGWRTWEYILTTGSSWANVIKRARIIFHISEKVTEDSFFYTSNIWGDSWLWNIEQNYFYQYVCNYEPASIVYNSKKKETVLTWDLRNIKPEKEWKFSSWRSCWQNPYYMKFEYLMYLLKDDFKAFEKYSEILDDRYYFYQNDSNLLEEKKYEENIRSMSAENFSSLIQCMYDSGFKNEQVKTDITAIYAQFLINSVYALHGHSFQTQKWTDIFSQFNWYNPSEDFSEDVFSKEEQAMIKQLKKFRKQK